jgi:hypothetical protein
VIVRALTLLGVAAFASGEPSAFGTARLGSLTVTASVFVGAKDVDMRWTNTRRC